MSQPKPSKKKSEYAGLAEDIKRQAQNKAEKQIKKRPKAVRDRRASKMPVLKQEAPVETTAVQEQPQPSNLGTGASHALAVQWRAPGGVAQTGPAPSFASPLGYGECERVVLGLWYDAAVEERNKLHTKQKNTQMGVFRLSSSAFPFVHVFAPIEWAYDKTPI